MKILLTAWALASHSGIPLFTRDLALALKAAGEDVAVYTLRPGAIAAQIAAHGIAVVTDLDRLPFRPDIIHGQDRPLLIEALQRLGGVPAVSVTHDATSAIDAPFAHPRIARHVGVDERCRARIAAIPTIAPARIAVILNAVDLQRFAPRPPLPEQPARALIFSNYATARTQLGPVTEACARCGLAVDVVGAGMGNPTTAPESMLGRYDIVFAKARCALEAMASGAAVVLCDYAGLGPMVSTANVEGLRRMNFGAGVLTLPLTAAAIAREIRKYDAHDAAGVSAYIRGEAGLADAAQRWLALYREALADVPRGDRREDDAALAALAGDWRVFRRLVPLAAAAQRVKQIPLVGGALHAAAARIWHWRY